MTPEPHDQRAAGRADHDRYRHRWGNVYRLTGTALGGADDQDHDRVD